MGRSPFSSILADHSRITPCSSCAITISSTAPCSENRSEASIKAFVRVNQTKRERNELSEFETDEFINLSYAVNVIDMKTSSIRLIVLS